MKLKRRKIKRRLKLKKRPSVKVGFPLDAFKLGRKECITPLCEQPVYSRRAKYCYYCNKVKEGLIDGEQIHCS